MLLVKEPKMTNNLFEVNGQLHKTIKSYVTRLEATLWTIADPNQCLAMTTYKQSLLIASKAIHDYPGLWPALDSLGIYYDANILISHHVPLEETWR